jgi:hypothetical protein
MALLILGLASASAEATVTMTTYDFSATAFQNITSGSTAPPPFTMVTGSITLTIDSTAGFGGQPAVTDGVVNAVNVPHPTIGFSGSPGSMIFLSGAPFGAALSPTTDNLEMVINHAAITPSIALLVYSNASANADFAAFQTSIAASTIPEPGSLALFGIALAATGAVYRRRADGQATPVRGKRRVIRKDSPCFRRADTSLH